MKKAKISGFLNFFDAPPTSWLFAPIFIFIGFLGISQGLQVYSLVCSRTEKAPNTCEMSHFTLSGTEIKQFPLSQLKEAKLETSKSAKSKIVNVVLITEKEAINFGSISSHYALGKQDIVYQINTFLQNPNQLKLSIQEPPSFFSLFGGITFSIVGLFILLSCLYFIYSCIYFFIKTLINLIKNK